VGDVVNSNDAWPRQRGFDRFYGIIIGAVSYYSPTTLTRENENVEREALEDDDYYITDAISDQAVKYIREHHERHSGEPFFQYVAYTAPHWPLHAREEDIAKYKGRYDQGWDRLREERLERLVSTGILDPAWKLTERDPSEPAWEDADDKEWRARCMEVYAAQIDRMDQGIGAIVKELEETGQLDNTLIIFLADNGGCAEELRSGMGDFLIQYHMATRETKQGKTVLFGNRHDYMPGNELTYQSYGVAWANLSNAPFRLYKHWIHEGGISTPLIMHWPGKVADEGSLRHTPGQLPDIMATILEATGAEYPSTYKGRDILPLEGTSLLPLLEQDGMARGPLYWEHEGNAGVREGKWKLVRKYPDAWELYDMERDRTELHNVAAQHPERVARMSEQYEHWAERCRVVPREKILSIGSAVAAAFNEE
jgi:arylsulfatase